MFSISGFRVGCEMQGLYGKVIEVVTILQVIYDKLTGRSRGFGFVTMSSKAEVEAAEQQFNGYVKFCPLFLPFISIFKCTCITMSV